MGSSGRYSKIGSMAELRAARRRISREVDDARGVLIERYEGFREMFSVGYLTGYLTNRLQQVYTWAESAYKGYQFAVSLFRRKGPAPADASDAEAGEATGVGHPGDEGSAQA